MSPPCPVTEYQIAAPVLGLLAEAPVLFPTTVEPHAIDIAFAQSSFVGGYKHEPSSLFAAAL